MNQICYDKASTPKGVDALFDNKIYVKKIDENGAWLTTKEAANFLKISPNALRILVHRAQVSYFKFGKRLRFKLGDLQLLFQRKEM